MATLHFAPDGAPRGRVALLHGIMSRADTWWRIGPALAARGYAVRALDLPGHGDAPRLSGPLDLDGLAAGVERELGGDVDVLVGHSLGAATALALAARRPGVARSLVLEDPPGERRPDDADSLADGILEDAEVARNDPDRLRRRVVAQNPAWTPEDVEHDVGGIRAADARYLAAGVREARSFRLNELLAAVRIPVLVLAASPAESALRDDRLAVRDAMAPGCFVELDGGHCLHRDLPEAWLESVAAFAERTLAPPG